jgi:TolA-binding protein
MNMNQILAIILVVIVAVIIAFPVLAFMGINTPLPFADWMSNITAYLSTINFAGIPGQIWAAIVTVGGLSGLSASLGYAVKQLKNQVSSVTNNFTSFKDKASQDLTKQQNLMAETQTKADTQLKTLNAEKEALAQQAEEAKAKALSLEEQVKRQVLEKEAAVKQNVANFTQNIPGNSVVMDPSTGNLIKTVEKIIVK